jgi:hypothetical protein
VTPRPEHDGRRAPDQDRRGAGVGPEIRPRAVRPRAEEQHLRGDGGPDGQERDDEQGPGRPAGDAPDHDGDDRPHEVELLLDREAPGVVERGRGAEGLPVGRGPGELPPVRDVDRRGDDGAPELEAGRGVDQPRSDEDHDGEEQPERGEEAAGAASPELAEAEAAPAEVVEDQACDEEARHREEQVDAEVAAPQVAGVERDDREHREAPEAVE